ncbi:peflin [Stomoxys calcitrans]|uniref:EF-hand domain-containing protein n=1 Tax=Stomoxys calcitrans TaxID=35570 RepID=A0A1I8PFS2_STOCA|nr:peflin [Stomoxys calcitrans]
MSYDGGYNPYGQGYSAPPGAYPPQNSQVSPDAQQWFNMVDRDRSGKINCEELQAALANGKGQSFSETACKLMISMFDNDASGTIDIYEFEKLFNYINQWLTVFKTYDRDGSGHIDENELQQALTQMGFRFSPEFINFLIKKSDPQGQKEVSVDQFIVLCVQIQRFTEAFRIRDTQQNGTITIGFEDFLTVAIGSSI